MKFLRGKELCELKGREKDSVGSSSTSKVNQLLSKQGELASMQLCSLSIRAEEMAKKQYKGIGEPCVHILGTGGE